MTTFFSFWGLKYMTTIDPMLNTLNYWPVGMVIISVGKWRIRVFKQSERERKKIYEVYKFKKKKKKKEVGQFENINDDKLI